MKSIPPGTKKIGIVDYGMGNLGSVINCLNLLDCKSQIVSNKLDIKKVDILILPGVGSFNEALKNLKKYSIYDEIDNFVAVKKKPFLGICLGAQLASSCSEENGLHKGFSWFDSKVLKIPNSKGIQVPHVGWNSLKITKKSLLWSGIKKFSNFYFDHSYYITTTKETNSETLHGIRFSASLEKENIVCAQFHPEKSHINGLRFIKNFLAISKNYI